MNTAAHTRENVAGSFAGGAMSLQVIAALGIGLAALLIIYESTAATALVQWRTSSAYSHGWLIAPIAAYIAWHDRARLRGLAAAPSLAGVGVVMLFALAWLAADFLSIDEGRHIALVGMIQGLLLAVLGWRIAGAMAFPILYLWLMVPTGTFLLAPLQHLSHAGAVMMLRISGIATHAENMTIEVPQGTFLVEPGCAGLNFLLTALALSLVFGKLTYSGWRARLMCVGVAVAASIIANIARIYLIIVITEVTHRKIDIASDHLLYGWCFFGVIMIGMMWLGTHFAGAPPEAVARLAGARREQAAPMRLGLVTATALALAAAAPALAAVTTARDASVRTLVLPDQVGPWRKVPAAADAWRPNMMPGASFDQAAYIDGDRRIDLGVVSYATQINGAEAAAGANRPAPADDIVAEGVWPIAINSAVLPVAAAEVRFQGAARPVLSWYESAGCITAQRLRAKVCAAEKRLQGAPFPGAYVAVSIARAGDADLADAALAGFARALILRGPLTAAGPE